MIAQYKCFLMYLSYKIGKILWNPKTQYLDNRDCSEEIQCSKYSQTFEVVYVCVFTNFICWIHHHQPVFANFCMLNSVTNFHGCKFWIHKRILILICPTRMRDFIKLSVTFLQPHLSQTGDLKGELWIYSRQIINFMALLNLVSLTSAQAQSF